MFQGHGGEHPTIFSALKITFVFVVSSISNRTNQWMRCKRTYALCSWIKGIRPLGPTWAVCTRAVKCPETRSRVTRTAGQRLRRLMLPWGKGSLSLGLIWHTHLCLRLPASEWITISNFNRLYIFYIFIT